MENYINYDNLSKYLPILFTGFYALVAMFIAYYCINRLKTAPKAHKRLPRKPKRPYPRRFKIIKLIDQSTYNRAQVARHLGLNNQQLSQKLNGWGKLDARQERLLLDFLKK